MNEKINRQDAIAVIIDLQEKLIPAMHGKDELTDTLVKMSKGIKAVGIPFIVTQQYTKGLGDTIAPVRDALGDFDPIDKFTFSAMDNQDFVDAFERSGKRDVILFGVETHICVQQTCLDLLENGCRVFLPADCCDSRNVKNSEISLGLLEKAGAHITSYESVLYELMGSAKADCFREISKIVK